MPVLRSVTELRSVFHPSLPFVGELPAGVRFFVSSIEVVDDRDFSSYALDVSKLCMDGFETDAYRDPEEFEFFSSASTAGLAPWKKNVTDEPCSVFVFGQIESTSVCFRVHGYRPCLWLDPRADPSFRGTATDIINVRTLVAAKLRLDPDVIGVEIETMRPYYGFHLEPETGGAANRIYVRVSLPNAHAVWTLQRRMFDHKKREPCVVRCSELPGRRFAFSLAMHKASPALVFSLVTGVTPSQWSATASPVTMPTSSSPRATTCDVELRCPVASLVPVSPEDQLGLPLPPILGASLDGEMYGSVGFPSGKIKEDCTIGVGVFFFRVSVPLEEYAVKVYLALGSCADPAFGEDEKDAYIVCYTDEYDLLCALRDLICVVADATIITGVRRLALLRGALLFLANKSFFAVGVVQHKGLRFPVLQGAIVQSVPEQVRTITF